jgi:monoamine oxidase
LKTRRAANKAFGMKHKSDHIIVIGAGASGLMAARELGRAGRQVTILEARDRCGGRIDPLPDARFGYRAEGGAEFVHGEAPVTRAVLREAKLALLPIHGARWNVQRGGFSQGEPTDAYADQLQQALADLTSDLTISEFLKRHFGGPEYASLRSSITRMVEGYDAADPAKASTMALRDEWMSDGTGAQTRIVGGYGSLVDFLSGECRRQGAAIHLNSVVRAIESRDGKVIVVCANGDRYEGDIAILTVPLPILGEMTLPPALRDGVAAAADIGFGNVIKTLLRFKTRWWIDARRDLADALFLLSDQPVPVWWTQHPDEHAVLTGWLAGPKTRAMDDLAEDQLIEAGLASLAGIFGIAQAQLKDSLVAARAINWGSDPFARGAYSYAMLASREAQSALTSAPDAAVLIAGEALYRGRDMGTVEAALASGQEAARTILSRG